MNDPSAKETRARWESYYKTLDGEVASPNFQRDLLKYAYTHTWHNSIRVIEEFGGLTDGQKVLDAGSGWGRLLIGILNRHKNLEVTALDAQAEALRLGSQLLGGGRNGNVVRWVGGDIESIPIGDAEFDVVYSARVFQHVAVPQTGVSELLRVLRPGGRFVVFVNNKLCPLNLRYYARLHSPGELRRWFENCRPAKLKVRSMDFFPGALSFLPLPLRMNIERRLERVAGLNRFGGKAVAWGRK